MGPSAQETMSAGIPRIDSEKARRAARDARRPGENCGAPANAWLPMIDRNSCEGKRDCVEVCPYGVFEVRKIDQQDFSKLTFLGRLKSRVHGGLTAYTPKADLCRACGLCVVACPEKAITLISHKEWLGLGGD